MDKIIFQPYGKDEFYLNLVATKDGEWLFGPSDIGAFDNIKQQSVVHSYVLVKGKNPRYHKLYLNDGFELKRDSKILTKKDTKSEVKSHTNELYIFLIYNYQNSFLHMDYVYTYEELEEIQKEFNILSTFIVIGDDLVVEKEKLGVGIGTHRENVVEMIEELRAEKKSIDDL